MHTPLEADPVEAFRHRHVFLGEAHDRNERKTWFVIAICTVMMLMEIIGGIWFGSVALIADGLHMSTHAGALLIAALAYVYARRYVDDPRFSFGTGKFGDLAAFTSAIALMMVALLIAYEAVDRFFNPVPIHFAEAIPIAFLGLAVNVVSAFLLHDDHHHHGHGHDHHGHGHDDDDDDDHDHDHDHHDGHDHHDDHDHDHDHHHGHDHADHHDHRAAYRRDNNLRAAFVHVASDVVVSVLVIIGLFAARQLGWLWLDPVVGLLGALAVGSWSLILIRSTGAVLLDTCPDPRLPRVITERLERDGDRITDLHVWRVGPGHVAGIVSLVSPRPERPEVYKQRLAGVRGLSHLTVEVEPLHSKAAAAE